MSDSLSIQRWIQFAQRDFDAAYNMSVLHQPIPLDIVCYLCQQSVEKILKAYTLAQSEPLAKTHDLKSILKQCMRYDNEFATFVDACAILTGYAIASRYPLDEDWIEQHDMEVALKSAQEILKFTKKRLSELGYVDAESEKAESSSKE